MKKFTLLLSALLMVSFLALAQIKMIVHLNDAEPIEVYANSVDSITFVNESIDPDEPDTPTPEVKKIKYVVEQANWLTYTSDIHREYDLNIVYKSVTTRGEDAKYVKEYTNYKNEEPFYKYIVENEGNKDMYQTVPINPGPIDRWTIVWYDDARTKQKEYEAIHSNQVYDYDNQERLIAIRGYSDGVLTYDAEFRYEGLVRYGIRTYRENGTIYQYEKDTITFYNNTFAEEAVKESRSKFSNINQTSYSYTKCEIGEWGRTKEEFYYVSYNNNNELDYESSGVKLFTWQDELNCTWTSDVTSKTKDFDGKYVENTSIEEGYNKYRYGGETITPDEPEEDPLKPVDPSLPTVLGTAGKYTIAFKIPEVLECNPIINFFGPFQDHDTSDPDAPVAEKIEVEGFENWYKVSFEAADPAQANGKLCPQMGGVGTWNAQGTYTLIKGEAEIQDDYGKSNHISCKEAALGQVVYVDVTKWAQNPCNRPNEAGPATYEVIIKTDFPADLDPYNDIIVSATVGWYTDAMEMVYDPSYTGEGLRFTGSVDECPANEQYKYVISYKGSYWIYEKGNNRIMPYGNKAKDEVTEWDSEPWNNTTSPNEPEEPITPPATPEIPDIPEIEQPAADKTTFLVR
ncbi:MAG: hypothetical protein UFP03_05105, partial [Paludibacteraceae bacterium]|nr:hypothetical protein [Paludibacteraceae bacterium]